MLQNVKVVSVAAVLTVPVYATTTGMEENKSNQPGDFEKTFSIYHGCSENSNTFKQEIDQGLERIDRERSSSDPVLRKLRLSLEEEMRQLEKHIMSSKRSLASLETRVPDDCLSQSSKRNGTKSKKSRKPKRKVNRMNDPSMMAPVFFQCVLSTWLEKIESLLTTKIVRNQDVRILRNSLQNTINENLDKLTSLKSFQNYPEPVRFSMYWDCIEKIVKKDVQTMKKVEIAFIQQLEYYTELYNAHKKSYPEAYGLKKKVKKSLKLKKKANKKPKKQKKN